MATIFEIAHRPGGVIKKVTLGGRQQDGRHFFRCPLFLDFTKNRLPTVSNAWGGDITPGQQLKVLLTDFIAGKPLEHSRQFHALRPHDDGVWELKTEDARVFGWFPQFDCFVAFDGSGAFEVKNEDAYESHIKAVVEFRETLDLDEPKFIPGSDPRAVISF